MIGALTDRVVLEAWAGSRGRPAGSIADALLAGALATGEHAGTDPDRWPLARRHAALAALHAARWGSQVDAVATCPACAAQISVDFQLDAVPAPAAPPADGAFRLPTPADVRAAAQAADPRRALVERCLIAPGGDLAEPALDEIAAAMEAADPLGALELRLACPDCAHVWDEPFELDAFLAAEAQHDARAIAGEVHELALAYGWTEAEILALPAQRRQLYLELVQT